MRILCIDGDYFVSAFRSLGHDVLALGMGGNVDVKAGQLLSLRKLQDILAARGFTPDVALWSDTCKPPMVAGMEALPWPSMAFSVDQYLNPWHQAFSAGFDAAFVAQRDYLPMFAAEHPRPAVWLPLFCDPGALADPAPARDIPVSFVGTQDPPFNPGRKALLSDFRRLCPLVAVTGAYGPVYSRSRLVLNQSAAGELNFRIFEGMCCGAAMLTEDVGNGLTELFTPGEDILVYPRGDAAAAAAVARAALAGPDTAALAARGQEKVLRAHTVTARAKTILAWAERLLARQAHAARLRGLDGLRARMANAYRILAMDEKLPLTPQYRAFFLELAASNTQ